MLWFGLIFLIAIVYFLYFSSRKISKAKPSNQRAHFKQKQYSSETNQAQSFLPPIPKDHQIYSSNMLVAGITFRKDNAIDFARDSNQILELERDPNNQHDKNAIKVIGVTPTSRYFVGFVPKEVSEQIIATNMFDNVKARLARIYQGNDGYIEIQFQIIGLKTNKKHYDAFLENQPADSSQKEYYKFFGLAIPKSLTSGQANQTITAHRKKLEVEDVSRLEEYDGYNNILTEFDDSDFRETYDLKKVSKTVLNDALQQLIEEGKTYAYLSDNIDEVVEKVFLLKPELEKF